MLIYLYLIAGFVLGFYIHPVALFIWLGAPLVLW